MTVYQEYTDSAGIHFTAAIDDDGPCVIVDDKNYPPVSTRLPYATIDEARKNIDDYAAMCAEESKR